MGCQINKNLCKSPLNYTGGKYKLLPQIFPLFPTKINTFVDLFGGGFNVGLNINANKIIYNDIDMAVFSLLKDLSLLDSSIALSILKNTINKYNLSKTNQEGFIQIRSDYNKGNKSWDMFYALITHSFNNQIRFNKNGEYNMPFGKNRSSFNSTLEKRFIDFVDKLNSIDVKFFSSDFRKIKVDKLSEGDFVYCDPPYLITTATYNESGGWCEKDELDLYKMLDKVNENNIKFALSNVFESKGKNNDLLKEWSKNYKINYLNYDYSNCNYHAKNKVQGKTIEVLITNY